ncbi:Chemotaxis protein methyltransferase Cher2 [Tsuneonella dongtanensis]|uniref:protein-glutamate O-methyltransferase n=1 Tax=Tsuneonella dongtanensis TaxID=692370 RepID=A0A1B2ABL2_9SPHN|nr:protein-glutamate O-methyltransferase CheR [Tsuneonella dongtanensis]ANY19468.1 Chemotaxis protein methyltransferase Cher2 [Tsuneonella dongtanensis]
MSEISQRIIADLLFARTGQQLAENRRWRIQTALAGLLRERGISKLDELVCLLAEDPTDTLAQDVVEALLNNETYFFRDRLMFDLLASEVLPDLAAKRSACRRLSIWSAGCSTGQEALSLAMIFADQPEVWQGWRIDILGTDISAKAIDAARRGCYSQFEIQRGLGVTQMLDWFEETGEGWKPRRELSRRLRFERRNVLDAPPDPGRFDLVLCRNVLLYFDRSYRERGFGRLAQAVASDGWLMIGAGESASGHTGAFAPACDTSGLYRRAPASDRQAAGGRRHGA